MPSLEAVCAKLFGRPGWIPKVLWGGALSFVPGINLFALGYLLTYALQIRHNRNFDLPEWSDMSIGELFMNGLKLFALLVAYIGVPLFAGWLVGILLFLFSFGLLGIVAFFPIAVAGFFSPMLLLRALHAYLRHEEFADAWNVRVIVRSAFTDWKHLALPIVTFWGVFLMAIPVYGLSFFIGMWVLIAYSSALRIKNFS